MVIGQAMSLTNWLDKTKENEVYIYFSGSCRVTNHWLCSQLFTFSLVPISPMPSLLCDVLYILWWAISPWWMGAGFSSWALDKSYIFFVCHFNFTCLGKWRFYNQGLWTHQNLFVYLKVESISTEAYNPWWQWKWGFINKKGKFVIQPQYSVVGDFNDGHAYVIHRTEETKDDGTYIHNHIAYIDKHGKIIIPFYEGGSYFYNYSSGLVAVQNGDSTYCSYKDKKGRTILSSNYFEKTGWINTTDAGCHWFHEGLLNVYKYTDDTYKTRISAYMNKKGEIVHSKKFDVPEEVEPLCDFDSFSEGRQDLG